MDALWISTVYLEKFISFIAFYLGYIFFDFLLLVFFADHQHVLGINNDIIMQSLQEDEFVVRDMYHAVIGIHAIYVPIMGRSLIFLICVVA